MTNENRNAAVDRPRPDLDLRPSGRMDDRTMMERLYRAGDVDARTRPPLVIARNAAAVVVSLAVMVQVAIWVAIGAASGGLGPPWWVWTAGGGALLVAGLTAIARHGQASTTEGVMIHAPHRETEQAGAAVGRPSLTWTKALPLTLGVLVVSTVAELAVWLIQGMRNDGYDTLWWTWSSLPLAGVTLVVWVLARNEQRDDD